MGTISTLIRGRTDYRLIESRLFVALRHISHCLPTSKRPRNTQLKLITGNVQPHLVLIATDTPTTNNKYDYSIRIMLYCVPM